MAGAGTGAGVVGARGEMMEMKSERMKAKSVIIILSCGVVCIVWNKSSLWVVCCLECSVGNVLIKVGAVCQHLECDINNILGVTCARCIVARTRSVLQ